MVDAARYKDPTAAFVSQVDECFKGVVMLPHLIDGYPAHVLIRGVGHQVTATLVIERPKPEPGRPLIA